MQREEEGSNGRDEDDINTSILPSRSKISFSFPPVPITCCTLRLILFPCATRRGQHWKGSSTIIP